MPSDIKRQVRGIFVTPAGEPVTNKTLTFFRSRRVVTPAGDSTVVDEPFFATTDGTGLLDKEMLAGNYMVMVKLSDVDRYFNMAVPDEPGPHNPVDLLDYADPGDPVLTQVQQLVLKARAWAENPEDVEVDPVNYPGEYSARNHALKAAAVEQRIDLGALDAAVMQTGLDAQATAADRQAAANAAETAAEDAASAANAQIAPNVADAELAKAGAIAARDAAFVNADVFSDISTGRAAVSDGDQFQVVNGDVIIRYRRDSSTTQTEMARYPSSTNVAEMRSSLSVPSHTYGVTGALADGANASFGTYGFPDLIPRDGIGVRYTFRPRAAGTIYVQIQEVDGDDKTVVAERLITVDGAGPEQTIDFLDLPYEEGQILGVRASPAGVLGALVAADPVGWWYTTAAVSVGGTYTDATLSTNAIINHRFELLEQVATGERVKALEDGQNGIVGADGGAASFHLHLVLGESHAAGVPTTLSPQVVPEGRGYCYRRATTSLGPLQDPTGNTATAIAGNGRGSPWVAFGSQVLRQSSNLQGAIVVNSGYGGTTAVGQWASGGIAWTQAVTDYGNALTAIDTDQHIISGRSISIILGSNDAAAGTSKAAFKAALLDLISRARTLVSAGDDVPVTLMKTGPFADGSHAAAVAYIQEAQEEISAEESNVYLGFSAEYAVDKGQMIDNVHMTQGFYDLCGASIAIPSVMHGAGK